MAMVWAKRLFKTANYEPYQDRLAKLQLAYAPQYAQFMMVTVEHDDMSETCYVGVPDKTLLGVFDGFEPVAESELPKEIDGVLLADTTKTEFTSRFRSKPSKYERR